MDKVQLLKERRKEIGMKLEISGHALALLALGSGGIEEDRMDQYSDLDFFVIVKDGYKQCYIENMDWLEEISPVIFKFKNTADGYKLLFEDDVFCEFAVFELHELEHVSYSKGKIIWKEESFDESFCIPKENAANAQNEDLEWLIGEALTNIYIGIGRYQRGEKLSAYYFIQNYAVGRIVDIASIKLEAQSSFADSFDPSRRFEQRYPDMAKILPGMIQGYDKTIESALAILIYLDENFNINRGIKEKIILMSKTLMEENPTCKYRN